MSKMTIVRYGIPTKLDQADFSSTCIVRDHHDEDYQLYVQTSKKEEPKWELIGIFNPRTSQYYIDQLVSMRLGL